MFCICKYNLSILKNVSVYHVAWMYLFQVMIPVSSLLYHLWCMCWLKGTIYWFAFLELSITMCFYFIRNHFCGYFRKTALLISLSILEFVMLHNIQNTFLYCYDWDFIDIIYSFKICSTFSYACWLLSMSVLYLNHLISDSNMCFSYSRALIIFIN